MEPTQIDGETTSPGDYEYVRRILIDALEHARMVRRVEFERGGIYLETEERDGVRCFLIHLEVKRL